jgi:general secretion pathway protein L
MNFFREFLAWYGAMLGSLLPRKLRERLQGGAGGLVVIADPTAPPMDARLALRARGGLRDIGTIGVLPANLASLARRGVTVDLSASPLILTVTLPLAVERSLPEAVAFEIDRLTPFDADEILLHTEILHRNRAAGTIRLRLAILPRRLLAPLLGALNAAGLTLTRIEATSEGRMIRFPLAPGAARAPRGEAWLAGLCAVLAVACLAIPLVRQQIVLSSLAAREAALAPRLHEAEALRQRLDAAQSGAATLNAAQARAGNLLAALAAITRAIPDRSFLTDLSIRQRIAILDGESPDAAALVAKLSANPAFADPGFAAPVTRAMNEKADIFSIRVRLRHHEAGTLMKPGHS